MATKKQAQKGEVMSKEQKKVAVVETKEQALTTVNLSDLMFTDAKEQSGFQTVTADDMALPFLVILQALSPQVRGTTKIQGAEEGMIYNTVTNKMFKSVKVVPCAYTKSWIEWTPREKGGGLVKIHTDATILEQTKKNERNQDILPNGNIVVTTAHHYVINLLQDGSYERAIISMTSTQLKKSRRWNTQMMSIQLDIKGKKITPPMYSHSYEVETTQETKDQNSWFGWVIKNPNLIQDPDLYLFARKFNEDILKGVIKVQAPPDDGITVEPTEAAVDEGQHF